MNRLYFIYKTQILVILSFLGLFIWGLTMTISNFSKKEKVLLIEINPEGVQLVQERDLANNPPDSLYIRNFLHRFVALHYNYNKDTFKENLQTSADLMSDSLWEKSQDNLAKIETDLKTKKYTQSAEVLKTTKIKDYEFEVVTIVSMMEPTGQDQSAKIKINVIFQRVKRTRENPWGFQIESLHEERI